MTARITIRAFIATVCVATGAAAYAQSMPPADDMKLAHDIYKEFVEIQSGYTTGATTPVAEAAAARLKAAGFTDSDIFLGGAVAEESQHGGALPRNRCAEASSAAGAYGRGGGEARGLDHGSVRLNEKDGYFYGRGTGDDKAQAAIWIANLIRYKREGFKPDRDIIVALTADEEGGGPYNGVDWLVKNHRELIDAEHCAERRRLGRDARTAKRFPTICR